MADALTRPKSLTVEYPVYCGVWTNWDRGSIMGSTLTLPRRDADKLIALTAFFVALVSSRFWSLAAQIYHRCYSTQDPRDALHHQRQAILRNSVSALSDFFQLMLLSWTWRGPVSRGFRRTLPVLISAVLCAAGFAAASVLSSWISTALNNEVLMSGHGCGIVMRSGTDFMSMGLVAPYVSRLVSNAENYAQQCYSSRSTRMFDCNLFVKDHLAGLIDQQSHCPFNSKICRNDSSNLYLDSGLLDSGTHFGLNTAPNERVLFRSVLHCAPLVTEGFTNIRNGTYANYTRYHYGSRGPEGMTYECLSRDCQYEDVGRTPDSHDEGAQDKFYDSNNGYGRNFALIYFESLVSNHTINVENSTFVPIPELFRSDGDIQIIFFIGNGIQFWERTEDAWYQGTAFAFEIHDPNRPWEKSRKIYFAEESASPLGCVKQFQFCNAALVPGKRCGPLAAWNDAVFESAQLFNNPGQELWEASEPTNSTGILFDWLTTLLNNAPISVDLLLQTLGPGSLASKANLIRGIMGRLPPNQWQLDVTHWWSTYLASIQAAFVETAIGPVDETGELERYRIGPWNDHLRKVCNNQKILSSHYTSFSMFGLCFTYALGILIIVASYATDPVCACLYRHFKFREYAHLEWTTNAALHFQRMAYQGVNSGEWSGQMDDIPRTQLGEILKELPMRSAAVVPQDGSGEQHE